MISNFRRAFTVALMSFAVVMASFSIAGRAGAAATSAGSWPGNADARSAIAEAASTIANFHAATTTPTQPTQTAAQLEQTLEQGMLALLNQERAANHKAALVWSTALHVSSAAHDLMMAKYNLMAHQCPGEADPGTRITKAGYNWSSWGENIGWTTDETLTGIQNMEKAMYNEKAPNDGHRVNILSGFKNVAIDVYPDPVHHVIWYTQDFGTPL